jgi:D-alanine-D-alanine ligase
MKADCRIAVIHGGNVEDPESVVFATRNPRSNKSYIEVATDIKNSLQRSGFHHVTLLPEDMNLPQRLKALKIDLAWINSAGLQGLSSTSHAPSILEMCGIPYVGHNPLNAALLDNKHIFKHVVASLGLPTARYVTINVGEEGDDVTQRRDFLKLFSDYQGDFIVKPVSGRASLHVHCVPRSGVMEAVRAVFSSTGNTVLVEEFLEGPEYTAGVSGPVVCRGGSVEIQPSSFVFSVIERLLDDGERIFTSKDLRPIGLGRLRLLSQDASDPAAQRLTAITQKLHMRLGLESTVRVDFRANAEGEIFILEANPKPDLKYPEESVVSLMAAGLHLHGLTYDDLILSLLADRVYAFLTKRPEYAVSLSRFLEH